MNNKLLFMIELIHRLTAIPISCADLNSREMIISHGFKDQNNPFISDQHLLHQLADKVRNFEKPCLEFENGVVAYGLFNDGQCKLFILGPVYLGDTAGVQTTDYFRLHKMSLGAARLRNCSLNDLLTSLISVIFFHSGQMLTANEITLNHGYELDLLYSASYQSYVMSSSEHERFRTSYTDEREFIKLVREGNVEGILALKNSTVVTDFVSLFEEHMGRLAVNKFKHFEYMTCVAVSLYCRAAIESGMDASVAFALSDLYLQRLEKCRTIPEMVELSLTVQLDYAKEVRSILSRQSRSSHVEKAKSYIANHLNKPFTLDDVADAAGISKPYLAVRFAEEEGVGVMVYVRNKRIEAAANMLKYSDECLSTIAAYLCFHSQSHFGARFKSIMGVTPHQYRELHRVIDVKK
ncbi:helix-turn-helix transcriptional regulator [bacterium]|nr:helix-turn-helix transcriptional regulator [candidate division CSSED10-310 bacterium]